MNHPQHTQQHQVREIFTAVRDHLSQQLIGRETLIERMLIALLCGGHLLLEGAPGLAKTRAIKLFADAIDTGFSRVQATPDLLPADLTGTTIFRQETANFEFMPGPLFNHVILVDEINRAPPKVQSALLEAMAEKQISVGGTTYPLLDPFLVAATQNPIEHEGTFPLPEAQLDRILFFIQIDLPDVDTEREILDLMLDGSPTDQTASSPIINRAQLATATEEVSQIHVSDAVRDYIVRLVAATRSNGDAEAASQHIEHPASPRGSIGLAEASRGKAWLEGRDHVLPADVSELAPDVLSGRIGLTYQAQAEGIRARELIEHIVQQTSIV